jgi:hypothetical protein
MAVWPACNDSPCWALNPILNVKLAVAPASSVNAGCWMTFARM